MAGSAPEGSQFDARQYDAKMDSVYVKKLSFLSLTSSSLCVLPYHIYVGVECLRTFVTVSVVQTARKSVLFFFSVL
jgi:hypothetical protein